MACAHSETPANRGHSRGGAEPAACSTQRGAGTERRCATGATSGVPGWGCGAGRLDRASEGGNRRSHTPTVHGEPLARGYCLRSCLGRLETGLAGPAGCSQAPRLRAVTRRPTPIFFQVPSQNDAKQNCGWSRGPRLRAVTGRPCTGRGIAPA